MKEATGGDEVKARFLYGEWFSYHPKFAIWMTGNHEPSIGGNDEAIWDRIRMIPFGERIRGTGREEKGVKAKLMAELPGILNWALEGYLRLRAKASARRPRCCRQPRTTAPNRTPSPGS